MADEQQDVNQEEAETSTVSTGENEQEQEQAEGDTSVSDGKDYKQLAENYQQAMKAERAKRKAAEAKLKSAPEVMPQMPQEDVEKRFIQAEANATIALKLQTDPSFRDRVEKVQEYVGLGYDINMADKLAKADIMDLILKELPKEVKTNQPKQIDTQAIPERKEFVETGDPLKDFLNDPNVPEAAKEAARRQFS